MPILGIDFGERRIGLAVSDDADRIALPLQTIERHSDRQAIETIRTVARERGIGAIVVGEPLTLDGERGTAAARVRRFGRRLAAATGLEVSYVTESLTSYEASRRLRGKKRGPGELDAVAAQILLQDALDHPGHLSPMRERR